MSKKTETIEQIIKKLRQRQLTLSGEEADFIIQELEHKLALCKRRHNHYMKHQDAEIQRSKDYQSSHYDEIKVKRHAAYLEQKKQLLERTKNGAKSLNKN